MFPLDFVQAFLMHLARTLTLSIRFAGSQKVVAIVRVLTHSAFACARVAFVMRFIWRQLIT
jgi:hypothetical protein